MTLSVQQRLMGSILTGALGDAWGSVHEGGVGPISFTPPVSCGITGHVAGHPMRGRQAGPSLKPQPMPSRAGSRCVLREARREGASTAPARGSLEYWAATIFRPAAASVPIWWRCPMFASRF